MQFEATRTFVNLPHICDTSSAGWRERMLEQADKVHEEAAEVMVEAKSYIDSVSGEQVDDWIVHENRSAMVSEIADVVQALSNLVECMGITEDEMRTATAACDARNEARGRF